MSNNPSTAPEFRIITLDGDIITAGLDEIGSVYPSDDVVYVNGIPARLSTANLIATECVWKYDDSDDFYATCGQGFMFSYHPPEPEFRFCPYCGRIINWQEDSTQ